MSKDSKFIGLHIPIAIDECLALWVVAHAETKSAKVRQLITDWTKQQSAAKNELVAMVIARVQSEWNIEKSETLWSLRGKPDKLEVAFDIHKSKLRSHLINKGLNTQIVNQIIAKLEI